MFQQRTNLAADLPDYRQAGGRSNLTFMLNFIDSYLNKITMYRLVLYFLIVLLGAAVIFSFFGILRFKLFDLIFSTVILLGVCWVTNKIFAYVFRVPANAESVYITAMILALIITPPQVGSAAYFPGLMFLFWAGVWSMAVKYIIAITGKHFFNPAAFAVALTALAINHSASWWVGTLWMLPIVLVGGLLVVRKIQRFDLVLSFLAMALASIIILSPSRSQPLVLLHKVITDTPILFFAFIMLTEPLTTPPNKLLRVAYGGLVGLIFSPAIHFGSVYSTPELTLLVGNIFSYAVSPKVKYLLSFESKEQIGSDIYNFVFRSKRRLKFQAGQYLEWTLGHKNSDGRGNRRYFTIASSPTEDKIYLGAKFYDEPSTFKQALRDLKVGDEVLAGQLAGEFTLPKDPDKKLAFIAGGIGITPFRSMLKYLLDKNERREIILFYTSRTEAEVAYKEIFEQATKQLGIKIVYVITERDGYLNAETIQTNAPDFQDRTYYISGPHSMVVAFEKTLKGLGIPRRQIKIDFFPGFV